MSDLEADSSKNGIDWESLNFQITHTLASIGSEDALIAISSPHASPKSVNYAYTCAYLQPRTLPVTEGATSA